VCVCMCVCVYICVRVFMLVCMPSRVWCVRCNQSEGRVDISVMLWVEVDVGEKWRYANTPLHGANGLGSTQPIVGDEN
jgi:hypothetical protein